MNIEINRINDSIESDPLNYPRLADEEYTYRLRDIAEKIAENKSEKPVILLSGPSGSGKTTTSLMIAEILSNMGCKAHTLSLDNYFSPLSQEQKHLASLGKMDLESPDRIDKELLNSQIEAIGKCRPVEIPSYNFAESTREKSGIILERKEGELVIFEGIHALNPALVTVPDNRLCRLYVSVRTRVTCGEIVLHPSKIRLLRRMIRDRLFRRRSFHETMNMFRSVEEGENKYIMPYKYRSDYDIDSFMPYELGVYKGFLGGQFKELDEIPELADVKRVLANTLSMDRKYVPENSLIKEFIGRK